jgi:hypothetical protein
MAEEDDMEASVPVTKLSYVSIASKGVVIANNTTKADSGSKCETISTDDDFTVVSKKKKQTVKKCETAVLQWAKTKGQAQVVSKPVTKCDSDEEIVCNRCGLPFVFNKGMKQRYAEKGWKTPKICKVCSQMRFEDRASNC